MSGTAHTATECQIPGDLNLQQHCCDYLEPVLKKTELKITVKQEGIKDSAFIFDLLLYNKAHHVKIQLCYEVYSFGILTFICIQG